MWLKRAWTNQFVCGIEAFFGELLLAADLSLSFCQCVDERSRSLHCVALLSDPLVGSSLARHNSARAKERYGRALARDRACREVQCVRILIISQSSGAATSSKHMTKM